MSLVEDRPFRQVENIQSTNIITATLATFVSAPPLRRNVLKYRFGAHSELTFSGFAVQGLREGAILIAYTSFDDITQTSSMPREIQEPLRVQTNSLDLGATSPPHIDKGSLQRLSKPFPNTLPKKVSDQSGEHPSRAETSVFGSSGGKKAARDCGTLPDEDADRL
ncbi:hypothetical protein BOTBODRAFT_48900 [Botryobasidium botryosum FD-172 SS1]|uniref:Uncharacterized protein n=1 Tax=Botryobasidium botryosum (strain FD-172 SS1) TaxID=930990 RepID=A0A067M6N9_BOTB1|nr:hypothetical protein BOTBODRAFT_48900 [Botryobasidium botryosum FD-172 SS1]